MQRAGQPLPADVEVPTAPPPFPYEMVTQQIQTIAHNTSLDSLVFPVDTLLPIVCKYAVSNGQDASIGADPAWPVLLFGQLGVAPNIIVRVLEQIFDTQEAPLTGRRRKSVVLWIDVAVDAWLCELDRRGGVSSTSRAAGEGVLGGWVSDLLSRCAECLQQILGARGNASNAEAEELVDLRMKTLALQKSVLKYTAASGMTASLFG
jgi:nuclear pore complex protein Nup155